MGDRLFDFVNNPANTILGGSGGMGDDTTIISRPKHAGKNVPDYVAKALALRVLCEQMVTLGQSQVKRGRNETVKQV